jgi:hypothetical protein
MIVSLLVVTSVDVTITYYDRRLFFQEHGA